MTLYEFNSLDDTPKYNVLWEYGVMIGNREELDSRFILYQIDSFYVELRYGKLENEILDMKTFLSDTLLEPYLKFINLNDL